MIYSILSIAEPKIIESSFDLSKVSSKSDFAFKVIALKEKNITNCRDILGINKSFNDFPKQLCSMIEKSHFSCALSCDEEHEENYSYTPLNSYNTYGCSNENCSLAPKEKMKQIQVLKNDVTCSISGSNFYELPAGEIAHQNESSLCREYKFDKKLTVVCHSLCKRPKTKEKN